MKRKILVIDDDHQLQIMISMMLKKAGFDVDMASDGNDGIERFKKNSFDLVITDIVMPNKDGLETIREMKHLYPGLKIIAMSGGGNIMVDNHLKLAKPLGANKTLKKPFSQKTLIAAVTGLLEEV